MAHPLSGQASTLHKVVDVVYPSAMRLHRQAVSYQPPGTNARCPRLFTLTLGTVHGHSEQTAPLLANLSYEHSLAKVPDSREDEDAAHCAFIRAFEQAKPLPLKIPGLQEFAGSVRVGG